MNIADVQAVFDEVNEHGIPYDIGVVRAADVEPIWCEYEQTHVSVLPEGIKSVIVYVILSTVAADYYFRDSLTPAFIHMLNRKHGNHFGNDGYRTNRKQLAVLAGLGKIGKQSLVFSRKFGLNCKIDAVITPLEFDDYAVYDGQPHLAQCASCPAPCVDECPVACKMDYHLEDIATCDDYITQDWGNPDLMCRACIVACKASEQKLADFNSEAGQRRGRPGQHQPTGRRAPKKW